ncbi:MAG: HAD hydrolase-like protein [bacterium]|nr:HAD hydrolase-like protein [bacterium]
MKIKAIIFDFDGTILESVGIKTAAFAFLFKDYPEHLPAVLALHKNHGGISRLEKFEMIYRDILCQTLSLEKKAEMGRQFAEYVYKGVVESPFVEGASEFLEEYHEKMSLFIASGTPEGEIRSIIKDRGLEKYFKAVYGSPLHKKDIILNILKDFNFIPQDVIFVGDSADDKEGADGADIPFIWQTQENNSFSELKKIINI